MKRVLFFTLVISSAIVFGADPVAPFNDYGPAMAHHDGYQMAVEWQDAKSTELIAATSEEAILKVVDSEASAMGLLTKLQPAYNTDPIAAAQIAAVSQWVMQEDDCFLFFWRPSHSDARKVWAKALFAKLNSTNDSYVKAFCLDQLRWCGCACQAEKIRTYAQGEQDKYLRQTAELVARGLME